MTKEDVKWHLLLNLKLHALEFMNDIIFVNLFQKSNAEFVTDFVSGAKNLLRNRV